MPYAPVQSTDQSDRSVTKFLQQFKGKPILEALLRAFVDEIQKIEDAAWEVILYRSIANGFGVVLDMIGDIVGKGRANLSDDDYKVALRAQIRINRSCGTPEDVIAVARLSVPSGFTLHYSEAYPATIIIQINEPITFSIPVLLLNLIAAKAGGVKLLLEYTAETNSFMFADNNAVQTDATQGFQDYVSGNYGGYLQSVASS